jgi:hypothetical protein
VQCGILVLSHLAAGHLMGWGSAPARDWVVKSMIKGHYCNPDCKDEVDLVWLSQHCCQYCLVMMCGMEFVEKSSLIHAIAQNHCAEPSCMPRGGMLVLSRTCEPDGVDALYPKSP